MAEVDIKLCTNCGVPYERRPRTSQRVWDESRFCPVCRPHRHRLDREKQRTGGSTMSDQSEAQDGLVHLPEVTPGNFRLGDEANTATPVTGGEPSEESADMATDVWVYPKRELGYNGEQREPGELFELGGLRNDGMLLKHGYLIRFEGKRDSLSTCDGCSKVFVDEGFLTQHYEGRIHPLSPNYEGPEARFHPEQPVPREEHLYTTVPGRTPRY